METPRSNEDQKQEELDKSYFSMNDSRNIGEEEKKQEEEKERTPTQQDQEQIVDQKEVIQNIEHMKEERRQQHLMKSGEKSTTISNPSV